MSQINFGLLQNAQNGFQNALNMGLQAGQAAVGFMEQRQQARDQNALKAYAANPTREGLAGLAQAAPDAAMQERARFDQIDQSQQQQQQAQNQTVRQLLNQAGASPEGWQQAMGAAQSMGIDTSRFPQQFDPQWAQQQLLIHEALSDPETATAVARDVEQMGLDPNSEAGRAAVIELTLYKYGKQTTDEYGRPTMSLPTINIPGAQQPPQAAMQQGPQSAPQPGTIEDGYRFRGGNPADPASWEQVGPQPVQRVGAQTTRVGASQLNALVTQFGPQEVERRMRAGEIVIGN